MLVRHVGFSKTLGSWFSSLYQIWCKNVDRRPNYGPKSEIQNVYLNLFLKFKMAAAAILELLHHHEVFSWATSACQIYVYSFEDIGIWIFA